MVSGAVNGKQGNEEGKSIKWTGGKGGRTEGRKEIDSKETMKEGMHKHRTDSKLTRRGVGGEEGKK